MENVDLSTITTYQVGAMQADVNRKLQKICDRILQPHNLTKMQWLIIGNVLDTQKTGIRISELADKLGTTLPFLTTSINLLESQKILERRQDLDKADTRSKFIVVSKDYVPVAKEVEATLRNGLRKTIYANVDREEFATYIKVLDSLSKVDLQDN